MRFLTISVFVVALIALSAFTPSTGTAHASTSEEITLEVPSGLSDWSLTRLLSVIRTSDGEAEEEQEVIEVELVPRDDWGAQGGEGDPMGRVDEVIVHHFWKPSIPDVVSPEEEAEVVRNVERVHVEDNGWSAFGYHFVVFQSGRVYEGRGWGREGGHTVGRNEDSVGIVFAIDGDTTEPTEEAWEAAEALVALGVAEGHLTGDVKISGHTDHAEKSCPGELIQPDIQRLAP